MIDKDIKENEIKNRNSYLFHFALDSNNISNKELNSDTKEDLSDKINGPKPKNIYKSKIITLDEENEKELNLENKDFLDAEIGKININENIIRESRKKEIKNEIYIFQKPRSFPKDPDPDEIVSPLTLHRKTFGSNEQSNKKPNKVLCDFQKTVIDCKSCNDNDEDSQEDFYLYSSETERTTPNPEDLHSLLDCRKKMTLFKNCINSRKVKECENILNIDDIFIDKTKKNAFLRKHIKQILKYSNKKENCDGFSKSTKNLIEIKDKNKEGGLFILNILESAANGRKGRYTTNI